MEEGRRRSDRSELLTALYDAAVAGDVPGLTTLLAQDNSILDRCSFEISNHGCFMQSPLHVAVNLGHLEFVKEILNHKPELADQHDHIKRWSPLHLAAAKGHSEMVKALIMYRGCESATACLARDQDGMNPFHVAATRGHNHVLDELRKIQPQAAREVTNRGENVLHLCVKYNKTHTLVHLVDVLDDSELLNAQDSLGNTILHLAVTTKQSEMVEFLVEHKHMKKNAINTNGLTALDICRKRDKSRRSNLEKEIERCLRRGWSVSGKHASKPHRRDRVNWLENKRNALMVVASLIATMAFQVGINPPGGVWQEDNTEHQAGTAVMAYGLYENQYKNLITFNTVGLFSSLSVILLLISGLPHNRLIVIILMIVMWIAITSVGAAYLIAMVFVSFADRTSLDGVLKIAVLSFLGWLIMLLVILLAHATRFLKNVVYLVRRLCIGRARSSTNSNMDVPMSVRGDRC